MIKTINNTGEMREFANFFIKNLPKNSKKGLVVALEGDLGSGKTTFTQQVADIFEIKDYVTSPTFVILKKYKINNSQELNFENLIHIDAYRLNSGEELLDLDWEKYILDSKNIIFVEWPEKISEVLPADTEKIKFKFIDENIKEVIFD